MAVQIPRLKEIGSSPTMPKNERINIKAPSGANDILKRTQTIASVAAEGAKAYEVFETNKFNQMGFAANNEFSSWIKTELAKLKSIKEDPTDAYVAFEKKATDKYNEILNKHQGLSERGKSYIKANLDKARMTYNDQMLKQRGAQEETYGKQLYDGSIRNAKENLVLTADEIKKNGVKFEVGLKNIEDVVRAKWGQPDGTLGKLGTLELAKHQSEGLTDSITALIDSGLKDEAKIALEKYGKFIDDKSEMSIKKKMENKDIKDESYVLGVQYDAMPEEEQKAKLSKLRDKNPKLYKQTLDVMGTLAERNRKLRVTKENKNYAALYGRVEDMIKAGTVNGMSDLESQPGFDTVWDNISPNQKKSIKQMFNAPKKSNTKNVVKIQDVLFNDIRYTSREEFAALMVDVDSKDRDKYMNKFNSLKKSDNAAQEKNYKTASKMLKENLIAKGIADENDTEELSKSNDALLEYLEHLPSNASYKEIKEHVDKFTSQLKKSKIFRWSYHAEPIVNIPDPRAAEEMNPKFDRKRVNTLRRLFRKENNMKGFPRDTDKAFIEYVNTNYNKR